MQGSTSKVQVFFWGTVFALTMAPAVLGIEDPGVGVEIATLRGPVYIPVAGSIQTSVVVLLPSAETAGIRFVPYLSGDQVKIAVAALRVKGGSEADAQEMNSHDYEAIESWPSTQIGTYDAKQGARLDLSDDLKKFDLREVTVRIVHARVSPVPGSTAPFFVAGAMKGSPPKGACMQLGQLAVACWRPATERKKK